MLKDLSTEYCNVIALSRLFQKVLSPIYMGADLQLTQFRDRESESQFSTDILLCYPVTALYWSISSFLDIVCK